MGFGREGDKIVKNTKSLKELLKKTESLRNLNVEETEKSVLYKIYVFFFLLVEKKVRRQERSQNKTG